MPENGVENNPRYEIVSALKEQGLDYGYATFWNSQVITVLSDSQVRAANIDVNEDGISPCRYQANAKWFEEQEGQDKYFVLLTEEETETLRATQDWFVFDALANERIDLDGWNVFVFDTTAFFGTNQ